MVPKSAEEVQFVRETKSDITFKVQDKLIPAHKQILMKESRYFANLLNSKNLKQDPIEIKDCESDVFVRKLIFLFHFFS